MKKKHFMWAFVLTICEVALLASCTVATPSENKENKLEASKDNRIGTRRYTFEGHNYLTFYGPCSSCSKVSTCSYPKIEYIIHAPDCPCQKAQKGQATAPEVTKEEESESQDPFDW